MLKPVLLDTSFLLRFLYEDDPLFKNADAYFQYLLGKDIAMYLSTIAIAEYCAGGKKDQLPFHHVKVLPFISTTQSVQVRSGPPSSGSGLSQANVRSSPTA